MKQAWHRARAALQARPVPVIGADDFDDTFLPGGYSDALWPGLAAALATYLHGRSASLMTTNTASSASRARTSSPSTTPSSAPTSTGRGTGRSGTRTPGGSTAPRPFQAWDNAWFNAACAFWPVRGPARPLHIRGAGLPGILMIQGTLDAATPYAGAQVAHRLLPTARMVVVQGGGNHGQSLALPPNTCVDGYVNRYLAAGALPEGRGLVNATCPALPPPGPAG